MSYCVKCGAALTPGAAYCGACGAPAGAAPLPAPAPLPPPVAHADPGAPSLGIAITALVLNIIVWPGLGSLIGGDSKGWTQGFLFLLGVLLVFTIIDIVIGVPLMIGMWVWGIVSGVRLVERANAKERATRAPY